VVEYAESEEETRLSDASILTVVCRYEVMVKGKVFPLQAWCGPEGG